MLKIRHANHFAQTLQTDTDILRLAVMLFDQKNCRSKNGKKCCECGSSSKEKNCATSTWGSFSFDGPMLSVSRRIHHFYFSDCVVVRSLDGNRIREREASVLSRQRPLIDECALPVCMYACICVCAQPPSRHLLLAPCYDAYTPRYVGYLNIVASLRMQT